MRMLFRSLPSQLLVFEFLSWIARHSDVLPESSIIALTSAPFCRSFWTASTWPASQRKWLQNGSGSDWKCKAITVPSGIVKRCPTIAVARIYSGATFDQHCDDFRMACVSNKFNSMDGRWFTPKWFGNIMQQFTPISYLITIYNKRNDLPARAA